MLTAGELGVNSWVSMVRLFHLKVIEAVTNVDEISTRPFQRWHQVVRGKDRANSARVDTSWSRFNGV